MNDSPINATPGDADYTDSSGNAVHVDPQPPPAPSPDPSPRQSRADADTSNADGTETHSGPPAPPAAPSGPGKDTQPPYGFPWDRFDSNDQGTWPSTYHNVGPADYDWGKFDRNNPDTWPNPWPGDLAPPTPDQNSEGWRDYQQNHDPGQFLRDHPPAPTDPNAPPTIGPDYEMPGDRERELEFPVEHEDHDPTEEQDIEEWLRHLGDRPEEKEERIPAEEYHPREISQSEPMPPPVEAAPPAEDAQEPPVGPDPDGGLKLASAETSGREPAAAAVFGEASPPDPTAPALEPIPAADPAPEPVPPVGATGQAPEPGPPADEPSPMQAQPDPAPQPDPSYDQGGYDQGGYDQGGYDEGGDYA